MEACKNGEYHWLQRRLSDTWLARIVRIFTLVGKLEWLDTGLIRDKGLIEFERIDRQ